MYHINTNSVHFILVWSSIHYTFTINSYYKFCSSTVKLYQLITNYSSIASLVTVFILLQLQLYQTLSPTAAAAGMKIITQLVLSLLLVNAHDYQYCASLYKQYKTFRSKCSPANIPIDNCCDLTGFPHTKIPSGIYQMKSCAVPCEISSFKTVTIYCWIL